jgi:hypothetical protein
VLKRKGGASAYDVAPRSFSKKQKRRRKKLLMEKKDVDPRKEKIKSDHMKEQMQTDELRNYIKHLDET